MTAPARVERPAAESSCLIVDDEPRLRAVLVRLMQADGFICREAGSGVEALAALDRQPVAILLTDLRMPQMDGAELLQNLRIKYPDTAVVMITAVADVEEAVHCLTLGAMDYLIKPFHLEEVRARVSQALEKRRLIIENRGYQGRLEDRVAAQAHRLEELFLATIQSFAEALEVKDRYTRGHSIRVSRYAGTVATVMGLPEELVKQIELGGHVHDIGKIGVREAVLGKAGALTPEEYEHIMTHPVVGWRILSPLLGDAPVVLNVVRSHHERYDGRGVPDRLGGQDIPLEARIAAVTDAFDAMTSGRPYRGAYMTMEQATEELLRNRRTQFDPDVVGAFMAATERGQIALLDLHAPGEPISGITQATRV